MSDSPFLRPGSDPGPVAESWPYEPPPVEKEPPVVPAAFSPGSAPASSVSAESPPRRRRRGLLVIAGLVGIVIGAVVGVWLTGLFLAKPEPMVITLDAFPENIHNLERPDLTLIEAKDTEGSEQFAADFEAQREAFNFSHGGDGAAVDYGQFVLTIVSGSQSLPLPSDPTLDDDTASPILISRDAEGVSCTFRPELGLYNSAVLQAPADLSARGWTQCVLNDSLHRVSLKLESSISGGSEETSARFADILEDVRAGLVD